MTLGEIGTTVTIRKIIVVTLSDLAPHRGHHLLIHLQTHLHLQQHRWEPLPILSQLETATHRKQKRHIQSHNTTRMTSTSTNWFSAAEGPARTRCITELGSDRTVSIRMELDHPTKLIFNNFIDEMFS